MVNWNRFMSEKNKTKQNKTKTQPRPLDNDYMCENEPNEEPTSGFYMIVEEAVSPALNNMLRTKKNRFTNNYHPSNAVKFMTSLIKALNESTRLWLEWWCKFRGSLSIGLLRFATRMALTESI